MLKLNLLLQESARLLKEAAQHAIRLLAITGLLIVPLSTTATTASAQTSDCQLNSAKGNIQARQLIDQGQALLNQVNSLAAAP